LATYFQRKDLLRDFDFEAMPEGSIGALFENWLTLSDNDRNSIDAEFKEIYEMGCEKGFNAILDESKFHLTKENKLSTFVEKLSALSNHYERAMFTFLEHRELWRGATYFYHADRLPYWKKRKNMPKLEASVDEVSIQQFADLISNYFHHTEGRGENCLVECFRRGNLDYFFAYPEDYSQRMIEWVNGEFSPRPHNPAFEIVYVYSQEEGRLDLNYRGNYKAIKPLQKMFAQAILKTDTLPPDPKDESIYDLASLLNRGFSFTYDIGSGIEKVVVKKLRLSSWVKKGDKITLEADADQNRYAIYDILDQLNKSIPLDRYHVTQVELRALVKKEFDKPAKSVSIRITYPNSCSLKYDELDLKLRDMLVASGIEPKEPNKGDASDRTHGTE